MEQPEKTILATTSSSIRGLLNLIDTLIHGTNNGAQAYDQVMGIAKQSAEMQREKMKAESKLKHKANMKRLREAEAAA